MRHLVFSVILAITALHAGLSSAAEAAPNPGFELVYTYEGAATWQGNFNGICRAAGIDFLTRSDWTIPVESDGGLLTLRYARVNWTVLNTGDDSPATHDPDRMWFEEIPLPPGKTTISWDNQGTGVAYSGAPIVSGAANLNISIRATKIDAGAIEPGPGAPSFWYPSEDMTPIPVTGGFAGWNRQFHIDGTVRAQGDSIFHLRRAVLESDDGRFVMPPFIREEQNVTVGIVTQKTLLYTDAFLTLSNAKFEVDPVASIVCRSLEGRHVGSFVGSIATGQARAAEETIGFENRALSLEGEYDVRERPSDEPDGVGKNGYVQAEAAGAIRVVGLDFAAVAVNGFALRPIELGLIASLLLLLSAALYKTHGAIIAFLYSRLSRDQVQEAARRELLLTAIRENPGIAVTNLRSLTSMPWGTLHYHLYRLERAGFVGKVKHGFSRRLYLRETVPAGKAKAIVWQSDERFLFLREQVSSGPRPMRSIVRAFKQRFGVSEARAYAAVNKAVEKGLVLKRREAGSIVIARSGGSEE